MNTFGLYVCRLSYLINLMMSRKPLCGHDYLYELL